MERFVSDLDRVMECLALQGEGGVTTTELSFRLGLPPGQIQTAIVSLVQLDLVSATGEPGTPARWDVTPMLAEQRAEHVKVGRWLVAGTLAERAGLGDTRVDTLWAGVFDYAVRELEKLRILDRQTRVDGSRLAVFLAVGIADRATAEGMAAHDRGHAIPLVAA